MTPKFKSHGSGKFQRRDFKKIGKNVVIEPGVLVFHPENIEIGNNVYIGHQTILHGYPHNKLVISSNVWIGPHCFIHAAGGIVIGENVGLGPYVKILTSVHDLGKDDLGPIANLPLRLAAACLGKGCDLGIAAIILPGVSLGEGTQVGAGSVVTKSTQPFSIVAGVPAKILRKRKAKRIKNS